MTKQYIYDTTVSLSREISIWCFQTTFLEAAKVSGHEAEKVVNEFKAEHPKLYQDIQDFASELKNLLDASETGNDAEVFSIKEDEEYGLFVFDTNIIEPTSFFVLTFLMDVEDAYFFAFDSEKDDEDLCDYHQYVDALEEYSGYTDLANFLRNGSFNEGELDYLQDCGYKYSDLYELLSAVFKGVLKEYPA